jgi:hypothetical protein
MKSRLWLPLIVIALLCLAGWKAEGQKGTPPAPRWEYKVVDLEGKNPTYAQDYETQLNQLGQQGWELVSEYQIEGNSNFVRFTLKRPR